MRASCAENMLSFEPIVEGLLMMGLEQEGWTCVERHRHVGGHLGSCEGQRYARLTRGELIDVVQAIIDGWGPYGIGADER